MEELQNGNAGDCHKTTTTTTTLLHFFVLFANINDNTTKVRCYFDASWEEKEEFPNYSFVVYIYFPTIASSVMICVPTIALQHKFMKFANEIIHF